MSSTGPAPSAPPPSAQPDVTRDVPLHETVPVTGDGPAQFAAPPFFPAANDNAKPEPFAPPASETAAPPPPITPDEVAGVALAIAMYFEAGVVALVARHAEDLQAMNLHPGAVLERLPVAKEFVRGSAERVCMKYGIRIPYQDEVVVAGALGVATFGLFGGKKKKQTEEHQSAAKPSAAAKDANPKAQPRPAGPPPPPMGGDGIEDES